MIAGGLAVAAVVGVGYTTYAANADAPSYRTASAVAGDVEQRLEVSGSVEPAGRADLAFATSGTVESIRVEAGDTVKAGAVLGSVDDTGLRKTLQQARATLASARAQLESDENDQVASVTTTTTTTTSATTTTTTPTATPAAKPTITPDPAVEELAALQTAVTDAQSTVSASLVTAREALAAQQAACAEEPAGQACADALVVVQTAQEQVATDQDALQVALDALARALTEALASQPETEPQQEQPQAPQPLVQQPPQVQQQVTQSTPPTPTVSAATLAKDQAAIEAARAEVITAEQALRTASVTAPFAGEVVAVGAAEGDSVSSGTAVFVLVAPGTSTVQVDATSAQVQQLAVGQDAVATPIGSDTELAGTVTQISTIPDDAGTYPVTVTLARKHLGIATGLTATVSVVVGAAEDAVTVPASAVTDGSVLVVGEDGTASRAPVTTGVVGATTIAITEGLEVGDEVVLADLDQALPTTDEGSTGGFQGGGFGGPPAFAQRGGA